MNLYFPDKPHISLKYHNHSFYFLFFAFKVVPFSRNIIKILSEFIVYPIRLSWLAHRFNKRGVNSQLDK
jgi:hypothetical protein